jgi:hypothetical protein
VKTAETVKTSTRCCSENTSVLASQVVSARRVSVVAERLEGAYATLERLHAHNAKELHSPLQEDPFFRVAGFHKPPTVESIKELFEDDDLFVWRVIPDGSDDPIGFAGIVTFSGPPFVFVHLFPGHEDIETGHEAVLQLVHAFFRNSDEPELWTYVAKPVDDEIHDLLIEGGFDPWLDALPGIDPDVDAAYIMERHTYDAYWGEGSEDPEI